MWALWETAFWAVFQIPVVGGVRPPHGRARMKSAAPSRRDCLRQMLADLRMPLSDGMLTLLLRPTAAP